MHKLDQRNSIEFFERQDDSSNYDLDAVPVPPNVLDNEIEWETTHPNKGGKDVRQTGNLDPPANTCLNIKVVYNSRWMSHFNDDQTAAEAGARAVFEEAVRIYQDKFAAENRLNSRITLAMAGGGK